MYKKLRSTKLYSLKKVLVVDDERLSREVLSKILSRYLGCEVYMASNSKEALSYLQSKEFDLLMIDLAMPGITGLELIKIVRSSKPDTSILVVTGNANDNDISTIKSMGVNQIVYKPFKISSLLEMVAEVLIEKENVSNYA